MPKIILGFAGKIGAGKTAAINYLKEKKQAATCKYSDPLRETLEIFYLPQTRENMQKLSTALRQALGEDLLSKTISRKVQDLFGAIIIVDGIRRPSDIIDLQTLPDFHLIAIETDPKIRYQRIVARQENPLDAQKTWEEFQKEDQAESETQIEKVAQAAEFHLNNNGSLENLYDRIDDILKQIAQ